METVHPLKQAYRDLRAKLLCVKEIRKRIIFDLLNHYYADLELVISMGNGFHCPLHFPDAVESLREIFFEGEYDCIDQIPLPHRWLDIGCFAGFFSLYVAWRHAKAGNTDPLTALLIDADPRVVSAVQRMIKMNKLENSMHFMYGGIGEQKNSMIFNMNRGMSSTIAAYPTPGSDKPKPVEVPILAVDDIANALPPPYDLIKIDIEGSEYQLIESYPQLLSSAKYLVLEWHSWHSGGGSKEQIISMLAELGFAVIVDVKERQACIPGHKVGTLLLSKQ